MTSSNFGGMIQCFPGIKTNLVAKDMSPKNKKRTRYWLILFFPFLESEPGVRGKVRAIL